MLSIRQMLVLGILLIAGGVWFVVWGNRTQREQQTVEPAGLADCEQQVAANVLITRPGTYCSPDRRWAVRIERDGEGALTYAVTGRTSAGPFSFADHTTFAADADWFMCWDKKGQFWSYAPELGVRRVYTDKGTLRACIVGLAGDLQRRLKIGSGNVRRPTTYLMRFTRACQKTSAWGFLK